MCLILILRRDDGAIILGANRDEYYDRPTEMPYVRLQHPRVLAGRDLRAGGTWLAVNEHGLVSAVTNRHDAEPKPGRPSRGLLPMVACRYETAAEAVDVLDMHLSAARYNGFNLLVADSENAFILQAPSETVSISRLDPGVHAVGNLGWDESTDPRVARAVRETEARLQGQRKTDPAGRVRAIEEVCRLHENTGAAMCVHLGEAGTVSSTVLRLNEDGRLTHYLHAAGPPCREPYLPVERNLMGED